MIISILVNTLSSVFFLDFNQCIGGLGRFFSKELNQSSVGFKSLSLPTKEIRESKDV